MEYIEVNLPYGHGCAQCIHYKKTETFCEGYGGDYYEYEFFCKLLKRNISPSGICGEYNFKGGNL